MIAFPCGIHPGNSYSGLAPMHVSIPPQRINAPGDQTFGRAKNLRKYFSVPPDLATRFQLVKFGNGQTDPKQHGDFSKPVVLERVLGISLGRQDCQYGSKTGPFFD